METFFNNISFQLEIVVTIIVIAIQARFFLRTKKSLAEFARTFPDEAKPYTVQNVLVRVIDHSIINPNSEYVNSEECFKVDLLALKKNDQTQYPVFRKILDATNKYLKSNKGSAADFHILQDITERISNSEEELISNTLSLPLFIGLMGTFLGVIIGLIFIFIGGNHNNNLITEESIRKFLGGVFIAMAGSLVGLILTTVNNSYFFKNAKSECDQAKNNYYNFLQSELLPVLNKDLASSLSSLKSTFDLLNRELSNNLVNRLQEFNNSLSDNVQQFNKSVEPISENLKLQRDFLNKIKDLGLKKVVEANLEIFKKITENTEVFNNLYELAQNLNHSVSASGKTADKINDLLSRVTDFENGINNLNKSITQNDSTFLEIGEYLRNKLDDIKSRYNLVKEHVSMSNGEIEKYLAEEKNRIDNLLQQANNSLVTNISLINTEIITEIKKSYEEMRKNNVGKELNILSDRLEKFTNEIIRRSNPTEDTFTLLNSQLETIAHQLIALNKKVSPPIFKPFSWFKFHFYRNGGVQNEEKLA